MLLLALCWLALPAVLVLCELPIWPVAPQAPRNMRVYAYDPRLPGLRWDLDGERVPA